MTDVLVTNEQLRDAALARVKSLHAQFMSALTDHQTTEERDTWPSKLAAAKFVITATDSEINDEIAKLAADDLTALLELDALTQDVGTDLTDLRALAAVIRAKSHAFNRLTGMAAKLKREGKNAILQATDAQLTVDQAGAALHDVEAGMDVKINEAIAKWQAS